MSFHDDLNSSLNDIADFGWEDITYNSKPIKASIQRGQDRQAVGRGAVLNEMEILVRKADVTTIAKDTPVIVDLENWKVWAKVGGSRLIHKLKLYNGAAVMPGRIQR